MGDTIDFTGVPEDIRSGGAGSYVPPGDYNVKVTEAEKRWKNNDRSNVPYYAWKFQVLEPQEFKGKVVHTNTSLSPEALFNLRNLIFACSGGKVNVAGKKLNFNPESLYGKVISITTDDREYKKEGADKAKLYTDVVDIRPLDDGSTVAATDKEAEVVEEVEGDEELEEVDLDNL